ncbi:MAG: cofactor-independent phosphoglycerate mutase [Candidatus Omnitrophota bacterium]
MKYAVLVADGMVDYPLEELGGKTPLEAAFTPNMDWIAEYGKVGMATMVPPGMPAGSDVANLSIFGYNPIDYYSGRGPLEAANMGIKLLTDEVAFRFNLITAKDDLLEDYSAGHISTREAEVLVRFLAQKLNSKNIKFYSGVSYRHLLVIKDATYTFEKIICIPPHDIIGKRISRNLPKGNGSEVLQRLIDRSKTLLAKHEINQVRIDLKENPANMIWPWGQGRLKALPLFYDKYKLTGNVISAVDLIKGIGKVIGLDPVNVPGATGYYDTDYAAKARYAVNCLKKNDFVFVHVEAPDEAGHNGDIRAKISAIQNFDREIVGGILAALNKYKSYRILVLADHPTPIAVRTHTAEPICFACCGTGIEKEKIKQLNEAVAQGSELRFKEGYKLLDYLIFA